MKKLLVIWCIVFSSCGFESKVIGDLNMVSTRNFDKTENYVLLKSNAGGSTREQKDARNETIEQAINDLVKQTAGGEYLTNVKIYRIEHRGTWFAVQGDIWGVTANRNMRGFHIGDRVQWSNLSGKHQGKVVGIDDYNEATVQEDGSDNVKKISYDRLIKM